MAPDIAKLPAAAFSLAAIDDEVVGLFSVDGAFLRVVEKTHHGNGLLGGRVRTSPPQYALAPRAPSKVCREPPAANSPLDRHRTRRGVRSHARPDHDAVGQRITACDAVAKGPGDLSWCTARCDLNHNFAVWQAYGLFWLHFWDSVARTEASFRTGS